MNITEPLNVGACVSAVINLAREMQGLAASGNNNSQVYENATNIMIECQRIRELTQSKSMAETTIQDIIDRLKG